MASMAHVPHGRTVLVMVVVVIVEVLVKVVVVVVDSAEAAKNHGEAVSCSNK